MRIGIDARFFGVRRKGLGRYTQKLVESLERIDSKNKYFVFLRAENFGEYAPQNANFKKVLADYRWYTLEEQLKFPGLLGRYNLDLVHFPHFNVPLFYFGKFVVTIHDLVLFHFSTVRSSTLNTFLYGFKFLMYRLVINSALRRSSRLITVSKFTKRDILKRYKTLPQEKIIVTYEAAEKFCMLSPNKDEDILSRYGIIRPYIMYVGNAYPHKNLENLVYAFKIMQTSKPELQLVFVGKEDYFYSRLKKLVTEQAINRIVFAGYVPDHDLDILFHNTGAYVFPSLYEGFGLPPLEAMAKGAPVVSSEHPCMREILEDSAYFFDGKNINAIADSALKVLGDKNLRARLIQKGYEQVKKYNWEDMALKTLGVYKSVVK